MYGMFFFLFQTIVAAYNDVYPAEEYDNKDVDDNCKCCCFSL